MSNKQAIDIIDSMIKKTKLKWWNGAWYMLEALEEAKYRIQSLPDTDEWIPVTERFPEKEWEYLTYVDLSFNKEIFHETCIRQLDWDWDNFWDWEWYTHNITHWKPLPNIPNQ